MNKHTLAYQSRVGPVEWLKPYTDVTIRFGSAPWMSTIDCGACRIDRLCLDIGLGIGSRFRFMVEIFR